MSDTPQAQPQSVRELFWAFNWLALQGFGGVLAVVQRELVEKRRWLTQAQFVEDWAVAQILPGPNVINLSLMIGGRHFGLKGAMAALAGMLLAPTVIVLLMAIAFAQVAGTPQAMGALRGMSAVTAGLITATGIKLIATMRSNVMGLRTCAVFALLTFVGVAWLRLPLATVLLALGVVATGWAWWVLRQQAQGVRP